MKQRSQEPVQLLSSDLSSSSMASVPDQSPSDSACFGPPSSIPSEDLPAGSNRDGNGGANENVTIDRRGDYSAVCKWTVHNFPRIKARSQWSKYFEVGGYDCRLLVYPKGDSQALPGYISIYLQIMDPRSTTSSKWDCFSSYCLGIVNVSDNSKTIHRDSWHRFSSKKKSHGWCDFAAASTIFDPKMGFLTNNDSVIISVDILVLNESVSFMRDNNDSQSFLVSSSVIPGPVSDILSGKFTWRVHNFSLFKEMIRTQKIMSPVFPAGECNLRISVYQSSMNGQEYLSMCLESKDTEKTVVSDRSCWCLFRMSLLNQKPGLSHIHKDSYGRFAGDNKSGDNTSLGWNDYTKMLDFVGPESGFLVDDTAIFTTSFHVIKESSSLLKSAGLLGGRSSSGARKSDGYVGKFIWRIENFTKLKDLLKKRKITGLCIKSRRFQIGNRDCRLIVYPRGQSQPPCHLSVFLEVTDSRNTSNDWSCFVSHRLSVVNQRAEEKSVTKESQNRYSKSAKDWGWREFVTLTNLFDQESGFLVQDTVIFSAEVLILKETSSLQDFSLHDTESVNSGSVNDMVFRQSSFTWKVENFLSFKEIMETRKIFSKFFQSGGCELRIGVYESFDTICIYLESDQSIGSDLDKNFWVRYRMAVVNQKNPSRTLWKESSICTKTWNNSVLQFMKVSDMLEADAGFLVRDSIVFVCEILDCCPWFEFSDLEVFASDDDEDALTTDPDELIDSEESECISGDEEDIFRNLLSRAGFHLSYGDNSQPQVTLREKLLMDAGAIAGFLTGLRVYLDDPTKVKRLLLPTKLCSSSDGKKTARSDESSPSLMNLLMGVKVLQQAIIDLLLDIMVECCRSSEAAAGDDLSYREPVPSFQAAVAARSAGSDKPSEAVESPQSAACERLNTPTDDFSIGSTSAAAPFSCSNGINLPVNDFFAPPLIPTVPDSEGCIENVCLRAKTKWPEHSEELLGLIVNSLRALDGVVPHCCPEPKRRPQSVQRIALVLNKAPKHLQTDIVALVPKLVDHSEHSSAARALLERLQKPDAEPSLQIPVFQALSQLEYDCDTREHVLFQSYKHLDGSNDESLAATIDFILKTASESQHISEAVRSVRTRLKSLGPAVGSCVLDLLSKTVSGWGDVAEAMLRDIDCDDDAHGGGSKFPNGIFLFGEHHGAASERMYMVDGEAFRSRRFSDIYLLLEMLAIPCVAVEASRVFERAVARGTITAQSIAIVLERRVTQKLKFHAKFVSELEGEANEQLRVQSDDFTLLLGLAETLALSRDLSVKALVKVLYTILFKWFVDESCRGRMLKRLVDRVISSTDDGDVILYLDILVILVSEEQEIIKPILSMLREVAELANVDRAALWHQLCASEDEIVRTREDRKEEVARLVQERNTVSQKLSESEAAHGHLKSEMKAETDRSAREKKEMSRKIQELNGQLEWLRSDHADKVSALVSERKALQDRLHDADTQLSQLKSRKRDELKRVVKEKNALAERLKSAEGARRRFDEELKRHATENVTREEIRKSLEDEVRRLTQTVGQTEGEKREKEEQVTRCEAYIDGMESKLQACQQYIHTLEASYQEEMSRHAPLYGAGLEALSLKELEAVVRIHEEGLRQVHILQQLRGNPVSSLIAPLSRPHSHGPYNHNGLAPSPQPIGLPPSLISNGVGILSNGHVPPTAAAAAAASTWYNHT